MSYPPSVDLSWARIFFEAVHSSATLPHDVLVAADCGHPPNVGAFHTVAKFGHQDSLQVNVKQHQLEEDGRGRGRINLIEQVSAWSHSTCLRIIYFCQILVHL